MPDALELLKTRRSVKPREMSGPGPSPAELETILTIGARVPDHGKLDAMALHRFRGRCAHPRRRSHCRRFCAEKSGCVAGRYRDRKAPADGCATGDRRRQLYQAASQGAAVGAGIVRGRQRHEHRHRGDRARLWRYWLSGWFAFDRDVLDGLGLKADEKLAGLIHIGTASKAERGPPAPGAVGDRDAVLGVPEQAELGEAVSERHKDAFTPPARRAGRT